jgi:hypothetical protein
MKACGGRCGVSGEHPDDTCPCPGCPPRNATWLVTGLPLPVLQVREDRDHGGGHRCRDAPRRAYPVITVTGTTDESCPYCGDTTGVAPTPGTSPRVQAWTCTACRTDWAITVVNPQPYFDRLAATVEQLSTTRSVLRQVITMADDAATLPDKELRDRLLALADRARLVNSQNPAYLIPRPAAG